MILGIGGLNSLQKYVGIPFQSGGRSSYGVDCWGLCCAIYENELDIQLPDWVLDGDIDLEDSGVSFAAVGDPVDFCLVRCKRSGYVPDHFGIYVGGGVFSADRPSSNYVPLDKFLEKYPDVTYLQMCLETEDA